MLVFRHWLTDARIYKEASFSYSSAHPTELRWQGLQFSKFSSPKQFLEFTCKIGDYPRVLRQLQSLQMILRQEKL